MTRRTYISIYIYICVYVFVCEAIVARHQEEEVYLSKLMFIFLPPDKQNECLSYHCCLYIDAECVCVHISVYVCMGVCCVCACDDLRCKKKRV